MGWSENMNDEKMKQVALALADEAMRKMHEGPIADVGPKRTKSILATSFLAVMQQTREETVREVAHVVSKADPPSPDIAQRVPEIFARAILSTFGVAS